MSPVAEVIEDTDVTPQRIKEGVQHLKEWLAKQPHLPNVDDEEWLATFLCQCKLSLEKTKSKLEGYFSYRNKYPQFLKNRNPADPEVILAGKSYGMSISSKLTKSGARILHFTPGEDPGIFDVDALAKRMFMVMDAMYLEKDRHTNYVTVTDCRHLHYMHFLRSLTRIPQIVDVYVNAYTERVISFNVINAPAFINKVVNMFKNYLPEKIANRIYVHEKASELLECEYVDEDVLAKEFGGNGPSIEEYDDFTVRLLEKHAGWFAEQESVCSNEELRRKDITNKTEELQGSFRKLEVD